MKVLAILFLLSVCFFSTEADQNIVSRHIRSSNGSKEARNVVSVDFCYRCLNESAKAKETYEELPDFSVLSNDPKGSLGSSFTICESVSTSSTGDRLIFFSLVVGGCDK